MTKTATKKTTPEQQQAITAARVAREIARREKLFKAANNAEKRVLIAKDVIAQIKTKKIKPTSGHFISAKQNPRVAESIYSSDLDDSDARKILLTNHITQCACCALGGLFVSCTLYNNNTTLNQFVYNNIGEVINRERYHRDGFSNGLDKFFSMAQLRLIEQTFEGNTGIVRDDMSDGTGKFHAHYSAASKAFYKTYATPTKRLLAIMRNIVANNGTFKLPKVARPAHKGVTRSSV